MNPHPDEPPPNGPSKIDHLGDASVRLRATEEARLQMAQWSLESGMSLEQVVEQACQTVTNVLCLARVGLWMFTDDDTCLKCVLLLETPGGFSGGAVLCVADFPEYFEALATRKVVPAEAAVGDPKTSVLAEAYLNPLGITSMLDAPIYVAGKIVGVLCCEHIGPIREWTTEERDFVASVADLVAIKIRAAEVQQLKALLNDNESQLMRLEKLELVSRLALGAAHDFRNLLTVIQTNVDILSLSSGWNDSQTESLTLIRTAAARGNELVQELVEFGKTRSNHPKVFNLADEVERLIPMLRSVIGSRWSLEVQVVVRSGKVFLDATDFQRVLLNLVINARDSMVDGGTIRLRFRERVNEVRSNQRIWLSKSWTTD